MADQFVAEIRLFPFNFAPAGWAICQGQIIAISQNTALFSLLGVNYGGNGTSNFGLPNLQSVVPVNQGQGPGLSPYVVGQSGGQATVTLLPTQMPAHNHAPACNTSPGNDYGPSNDFWAPDAGEANEYATSANAQMAGTALAPMGGGQPHTNMQPYLTLNYCIALQGIFPSRA